MQPDITALGIDLSAIAPLLVLSGTAMLVLVLGLFLKKEQRNLLTWLSLLGLAGTAAAVVISLGAVRLAFSNMLTIDSFYAFFALLSIVVTAITVVLSATYIERIGLPQAEYLGLLLFGAAGMVVMACASNLIVLLIGLELLSLALYVLAGFARTRFTSEEAALKYFLLGSFSLGLLIYGTALVYGETGTLDYAGIAKATQSLPEPGLMLMVGMGLILVGFAFKLSLVPFHMWVPDVYEGSPTPVTAYMAVGTKAIMFAALMRALAVAFPPVRTEWAAILAVLAALTMIWGNVAAVVQSNIKRLLGYSAISHAGYVLMGLVAGGNLANEAVLFYLVAYTAMNFGAFAVIVAVGGGREERLDLSDYAGLAKTNPWLAASMAIFMLSLAGVPFTAGFLAKLYVFSAAIQGGYLWLAVVGALTSVVAFYYYLKVVAKMYMAAPSSDTIGFKPSFSMATVLVITLFFTLQLGILPSLFHF